MSNSLTYRRKVKCAIINNRVEVWGEIVLPSHLIHRLKLEEVCSDKYVQDVLVIQLVDHFTLLIIIGLLQEANDVLKSF